MLGMFYMALLKKIGDSYKLYIFYANQDND